MSTRKKINKSSYDEQAIEFYRNEALSQEKTRIEREVLENGSPQDILYELGLVHDGELNEDGRILFSTSLQDSNPGATIRISKRSTGEIDEIEGCLVDQVRRTEELLRDKYDTVETVHDKLKKVRHSLYPRKALREILMNAVCHKDYTSQAPVQIKILDHYIKIYNPGPLPSGWDEKTLLTAHTSHPRNRRILLAFSKCFYVEHVGDGIQNILDDCKQTGTFAPLFVPIPTGLSVDLYFDSEGLLIKNGYKNPNHFKIINHVLRKEVINNSTVREICGVGKTMATNYLNHELSDLLIQAGSSGRGVEYTLNHDFVYKNLFEKS